MLRIMSSGVDVQIEFASFEAEALIATGHGVVANKKEFELAIDRLEKLSKGTQLEPLIKDFPVFIVDEQDVVETPGEGVLYNHVHLMTLVKMIFEQIPSEQAEDFKKNYSYDASQLS